MICRRCSRPSAASITIGRSASSATHQGLRPAVRRPKDNHAGLMTPAQMDALRKAMHIRQGHEWDKFEGLDPRPTQLQASRACRSRQAGARRHKPRRFRCRTNCRSTVQPVMSTQPGFGARAQRDRPGQTSFADRIVTTSPDVTVSTNLGAWVNRRGLFAREAWPTCSRASESVDVSLGVLAKGQHIELGIAEMNLFILLSALGLSHAINGERLIPVGTLYDPFISAASMRSTMPAIKTPASFWWHPVGHNACPGRRCAPVDRYAADRHGAGRTRRLRAGLRR